LAAAVTSETINGEGSRLVISHAVATLAIHPPMLVMRTAIQTVRNAGTVRGLQGVAIGLVAWEGVSATAHLKKLKALNGLPNAVGPLWPMNKFRTWLGRASTSRSLAGVNQCPLSISSSRV
jgi:hypothetical protein